MQQESRYAVQLFLIYLLIARNPGINRIFPESRDLLAPLLINNRQVGRVTSRSRIPKGKKELTVFISEDLYKQIIEIAPVWYGKHKGAVSALVEDLIRRALATYQHTQIRTKNPSRSVRAVYEQVVRRIMEVTGLDYRPDEIPEKYLDQAIAEVRGSDPRTIAKWKGIFERAKLIKYIGGFPPNRIIELL